MRESRYAHPRGQSGYLEILLGVDTLGVSEEEADADPTFSYVA